MTTCNDEVYVVGFAIDRVHREVLLIEKAKPQWQKGKLNGIGGRVELGETPHEAMIREFYEETGIHNFLWREFAIYYDRRLQVHFYRSYTNRYVIQSAANTEGKGESLVVAPIYGLPLNVIYNLRWLLPLALDPGRSQESVVTWYGQPHHD